MPRIRTQYAKKLFHRSHYTLGVGQAALESSCLRAMVEMGTGGKQGGLDAVLGTRNPFLAALAHLVQPRLSAPASQHQHGHTKVVLQIEKEDPSPASREQTQNGQNRGRSQWGESRLDRFTSALRDSHRGGRRPQEQSQHCRMACTFDGSASTVGFARAYASSPERRRQREGVGCRCRRD